MLFKPAGWGTGHLRRETNITAASPPSYSGHLWTFLDSRDSRPILCSVIGCYRSLTLIIIACCMAPSRLSYDLASCLHGQRGQVETVHSHAEVMCFWVCCLHTEKNVNFGAWSLAAKYAASAGSFKKYSQLGVRQGVFLKPPFGCLVASQMPMLDIQWHSLGCFVCWHTVCAEMFPVPTWSMNLEG